ncbi:Mini-ribonuclease 3 [Cohnella caldifontis]|uniref:Mini-ribonuclease 3 n=1 Tax=Cohnella caldifontis TaxID=3027471 RepID=UPI0023EE0AB8|nr:Mini-ribonuclease 3 [Cohnella sp. YIM B05605]
MTDREPAVYSSDPVIAPMPPSGIPVEQLSPVVLAYIGDAVFEVYVRQRLIAGPIRKPHELHRAATRYVSAAAQARLLQRWMPLLGEEEADVVRRGRNTKSGQPPKNADPGDYRHATALECLVGYLFYRGERGRLEQLIDLAFAPSEGPLSGEAKPGNLTLKEDQP